MLRFTTDCYLGAAHKWAQCVSLSRAGAALVRLESLVEQAGLLESTTDAGILDTAATYWERRTEALEALGWASEAAESRARALVIRARIAQMGSE